MPTDKPDVRIIMSRSGDAYAIRWDTDPRGLGGLWVERYLRTEHESESDVMRRARSQYAADQFFLVHPDVLHDLGDQLLDAANERYTDSR